MDTNAGACGSAWYVDRILRVDGADAELRALGDGGTFGEGASFDSPFDPPFDPHRVAVVDTSRFDWPFGTRFDTLSSRTVELVDYRTNRLTYRTSSPEQGVVVFSEIYYPKGWTATVDGVPAVYFRANYVLRAMVVPAGEHEVVFAFASPHFAKLVWITRICSLILLLGTLGLLIQTRLDTWPKREE